MWTEMVFNFFVFTYVPYCDFASVASTSEYPWYVSAELHREEVTLLHVSGANALRICSTIGSDIPDLDSAVK
jgi:hypothetical protein